MGIAGAGVGWVLRGTADALVLFVAVFWLKVVSWQGFVRNGLQKSAAVVSGFGLLLAGLGLAAHSGWRRGWFSALLVLGFGRAAWGYVLDPRDQQILISPPAVFPSAL